MYNHALEAGTRSRPILSEKRNGTDKCRIVKRGDLEDKLQQDGPDFTYTAHVCALRTIRMILSRNQSDKVLATIDISTAFLQANKFKDGKVKYTYWKDLFTGRIRCFEADGPQYGECSAPIYWLDTLHEFMISEGYVRCENEPSAYIHSQTGCIVAAYVDDLAMNGTATAVAEFIVHLKERFECKEEEYVTFTNSVDLLGMTLSKQNVDGIASLVISMEPYVNDVLETMQIKPNAKASSPIPEALHCHCVAPSECKECYKLQLLDVNQKRYFMKGVGCIGWLVATIRLDLMASHIRLSQYMAAPTIGALKAMEHVFQYLGNNSDWCLTSPLGDIPDGEWTFFADSDFAGNKELVNCLKAQCCSIAMHRGMPVSWKAGVSKTAFANEDIGEAHSDRSSGAAEVYGAGEAVQHLLPVKYIAKELQLAFPKPATLLLDAKTAVAFMKGTVRRSKLNHIDHSQQWVITLRDKGIFLGEWIPGALNLADLGTKLQGAQKFRPLLAAVLTRVALLLLEPNG